jgi:type II secretory pathway component PulJ
MRRSDGLTIVELLVVAAILGILLLMLTTFFTQQTRLSAATQARNEVEIKTRTAAEIMIQDLQVAGSRIVFDGTNVSYISILNPNTAGYLCSPLRGSNNPCVKIGQGSSFLTIYYATSLLTPPCRQVDYRLVGDTLQRSDVACGQVVSYQPFADGITDVALEFTCAKGGVEANPVDCYDNLDPPDFPQQARVTISGRSANTRENLTTTVTLNTTMPNLRPVAVSE